MPAKKRPKRKRSCREADSQEKKTGSSERTSEVPAETIPAREMQHCEGYFEVWVMHIATERYKYYSHIKRNHPDELRNEERARQVGELSECEKREAAHICASLTREQLTSLIIRLLEGEIQAELLRMEEVFCATRIQQRFPWMRERIAKKMAMGAFKGSEATRAKAELKGLHAVGLYTSLFHKYYDTEAGRTLLGDKKLTAERLCEEVAREMAREKQKTGQQDEHGKPVFVPKWTATSPATVKRLVSKKEPQLFSRLKGEYKKSLARQFRS